MAGAVVVTGVLGLAVVLAAGLGAVGNAAVHAQRLASAADFAALAAADAASGAAAGAPCERAEEVAGRGGATVTSCVLEGLIATVTITARFGVLPASATARAGPPP